MTDPIFYCYDNDCGFDDSSSHDVMKNDAETALSCVDEFTEDTEIHYGLLIKFAKLVDQDLVPVTPEETDASIRELDKRGLNTTANRLRSALHVALGALVVDRREDAIMAIRNALKDPSNEA